MTDKLINEYWSHFHSFPRPFLAAISYAISYVARDIPGHFISSPGFDVASFAAS